MFLHKKLRSFGTSGSRVEAFFYVLQEEKSAVVPLSTATGSLVAPLGSIQVLGTAPKGGRWASYSLPPCSCGVPSRETTGQFDFLFGSMILFQIKITIVSSRWGGEFV